MVDIDTRFVNRKGMYGTTPRNRRVGIAFHHSVTAEGTSQTSIDNLIRGMNNHSPSGGSYGWMIDFRGRIYEIVGVDRVGAAVYNGNTAWLSICYIGDGRYNFTREAERSFRMMVEYLDGLCGKRLQVKGHGQINSTACPGTLIQARINAGAFTQRYSKAHIKAVQEAFLKLGYNLGPWGADSDWGPMLSIATGQFQAKYGLFRDEIPGPATLAKAQAEAAKIGTPKPPVTPPVTPPVPPALTYVRWTEPLEMEFIKETHLYDFGINAMVASEKFPVGERIRIVGEVQEENVVYLMTEYSFANADTTGKPKFMRGFPVDSLEIYIAPEPPEDDPEEPEEPEPEDPEVPEEPVEPDPTDPEPEIPEESKNTLKVVLGSLIAALTALIAWLSTTGQ